MNSSNEQTRKAVRRSYHKRRVLELREERNRINKFLLEHRASSLHGAEISKLEKRLFRIEHLIQSSEYAYHTGGFGNSPRIAFGQHSTGTSNSTNRGRGHTQRRRVSEELRSQSTQRWLLR